MPMTSCALESILSESPLHRAPTTATAMITQFLASVDRPISALRRPKQLHAGCLPLRSARTGATEKHVTKPAARTNAAADDCVMHTAPATHHSRVSTNNASAERAPRASTPNSSSEATKSLNAVGRDFPAAEKTKTIPTNIRPATSVMLSILDLSHRQR